MTNRNLYFDFLRGVAIIMVIGIHCYTIDNNILFRQVLNAAVPLFIAVSGFFLSQKVIKDRISMLFFGGNKYLKFMFQLYFGHYRF